MVLFKKTFACLLIIIPWVYSDRITRKLPRDVNVISGKIMSFTGAGQQDLRDSIPGEPGVDYPIYESPPATSFSCFGRHEGYYADVETRCQVFRICSHTDHTGKGFAFLCPNGTLFSQHDFVCDWYRNVPCENSPNYYFMNELLDKTVSPHPDLLMKDIVAMVNYPMKIMKQQKTYANKFPQLEAIQSTTPKPIAIQYTPLPTINREPLPIRPIITPVRNPFESAVQQPRPSIFENRAPRIQQPKIQLPQIQQPQYQPVPITSAPVESATQPIIFEQPTYRPQYTPEVTNPPVSISPSTTLEPLPENNLGTSNYDPGKVYISSLGELSTDPGSNFDPKTAVILPDKSDDQSPIFTQAGNQEHLLEGKLEPVQSEASKNLLLNLENVASSIPGNINSQLALVRDQPNVDGPLIQVPGTLHVSLNYTQRINTALKNVLIPSEAQEQVVLNPILSGDGKLISQIYGQNQLRNNGGILKFAHNINSAFQLDNPLLGQDQQQSDDTKDLFNPREINLPQSQNGFRTSFDTGKGIQFATNIAPYGPDGKLKSQSVSSVPGSQEIQGVGYTKSNIAVSTPASILHTQTIYIPSINLKPTPDVTASTETQLLLDRTPVTLRSTLSSNALSDSRDQQAAAYQRYGFDSEQQRLNGLDDSKNHAKRAENLLIKGVQLSLYDEAEHRHPNFNDNRIDNADNVEKSTPQTEITPTIPSSTTKASIDLGPNEDDSKYEHLSVLPSTEDIFHSLVAPTQSYSFSETTSQDSSSKPLKVEISTSEPPPFDESDNQPTLSSASFSSTTTPSQTEDLPLNLNPVTPFVSITSTESSPEPEVVTITPSTSARPIPTSTAATTTTTPELIQTITVLPSASSSPADPTEISIVTSNFKSIAPRNRYFSRARKANPLFGKYSATISTSTTSEPSATTPATDTKNRFFARLRSNRRTLTQTSTTSTTPIPETTVQVLVDTTDIETASPLGIRSALGKTRKIKKFKVLKRRKLTFIEDNNRPNLSKVKYTSTINSNSSTSNSTTSPASNSLSNNQNNTTDHITNNLNNSNESSRRRLQSTTHIVHNQSVKPNDARNNKATSAYLNIPGTKISIAKSIEEGFFSVSNYPLLPHDNKAMSFSSIFPGIIIHPGSPFTIRQKSQLDSNFLLPFPTTSTIRTTPPTTTSARPSTVAQFRNDGFSSTPIPSLTSIPLASHSALRRSDIFGNDDDDEDSFFKGVSSYHVPLSSVGRLPADIQGTKKR